jgi:hypothetical protein
MLAEEDVSRQSSSLREIRERRLVTHKVEKVETQQLTQKWQVFRTVILREFGSCSFTGGARRNVSGETRLTHSPFYRVTATFAGQPVLVQTLVGAPQIQRVLFRLPDGNMDGSGYPSTGYTSLRQL